MLNSDHNKTTAKNSNEPTIRRAIVSLVAHTLVQRNVNKLAWRPIQVLQYSSGKRDLFIPTVSTKMKLRILFMRECAHTHTQTRDVPFDTLEYEKPKKKMRQKFISWNGQR